MAVTNLISRACITALLVYLAACSLSVILDQRTKVIVPFSSRDKILAKFNSSCLSEGCPVLGEGFFFGLATAPAHVEDQLNDAWLEFALRGNNDGPQRGPVRAFHNYARPEERLRFWSDPETELNLAQNAGAEAFRMGVDWGRLVMAEPVEGTRAVLDTAAVAHYRTIMQKVRERKMKIMVTLFHHSMPKWALAYGGWLDPRMEAYFADFARVAKEEFGDLVDYWCTFNEPTIFAILTHCAGAWPPGEVPSLLGSAVCFSPLGAYGRAMAAIGRAHNRAYKVLREGSSVPVGVAHNIGWQRAYSIVDVPIVLVTNWLMLFPWTDHIQDNLDYLGLNYYGQEFVSAVGLQLADSEEYSEAGRGVYPDGLYRLLLAFHLRYSPRHPTLRYIITENGMADARDIIRRPYVVEHLLALHAAMKQGVPVDGYFHWTISDNWEWADGYCPKFGLVDVDRADNITRRPRPSYYLYSDILRSRQLTRAQREEEWGTLQRDAAAGGLRPFCRAVDYAGRMWSDSLDAPEMRDISRKDWRFGIYEQPGLLLSSKRSLKVVWTVFADLFRVLLGRKPGAAEEPFAEKFTGAREL